MVGGEESVEPLTEITIDQAMQRAMRHHEAGRLAEAEAIYRRVLWREPIRADALHLLGALACQAGHPAAAIELISRSIELAPDQAEACNNLGVALNELGRTDEALAACSRAIALQPVYARAHYTQGNILWQVGRLDLAIAALTRAIELDPGLAEAHNNLAGALKDQGRLDEALRALDSALAVKPDFAWAASHRLFLLHYHPDFDAAAILEQSRRWAQRFAEPLAAQIGSHDNGRSPGRRLRVGFLSTGFRESAQGQLIQPLFLHHDRAQFEFVGYSDTRKPDAVTARLRDMVEEWHDTAQRSDAELAGQIRADRIDILVDLTLHTAHSRLLVFARKPAPIQLTALEMNTTTGLDAIDYHLTDCYLDPPAETEGHYTEQLIRLPHSLWCYPPPPETPPVGVLPAQSNGFVTFGCQNYFIKISRPTQELWARVLLAVPGARMLIHSPSERQWEGILRVFGRAGIAPDRIAFLPTTSRSAYMQRYGKFDICLDTQPYAGGTTTMDSLWMGVPVVTLRGNTAAGRGGVSILSTLGLPELIARSPEQYMAIAADWARDLDRLAAVRAALRGRMQSSPLMDGMKYADGVQARLRMLWMIYCQRISVN